MRACDMVWNNSRDTKRVIPGYRGKGLGSAAMYETLMEAKKGGMGLALLQIPEMCKEFFEKVGFETTHTIENMVSK